MPLDKTKIAKLHQTMADNGADVGDINEFTKWFSGNDHYENRYRVYKLFKDNGADVGKDYNEFMSWVKQPEKQTPTIWEKAKQISQKDKKAQGQGWFGKVRAGVNAAKGQPQTKGQPWSYDAAKQRQKQLQAPGKAQADFDYLSRPQMTQQDILSGQGLVNAVEKRREAVAEVPNKGVEQLKQEQVRKSQPVARTNTPADQYIVKNQGQWEDELAKSVDELISEPIADDVDSAIAKADADYRSALEANSQIGVPAEAAPMWGLMTEGAANRQRDPEKVFAGLVQNAQQRYQEYFSQPETLEKIKSQADRMGITPDDYINQVVLPQIEGRLKEQFDKTQIARNMPSGRAEYLLRGLGDSIIGTLASQLATTKAQRQYAQMGDEEYRRQRGGGFWGGVEDAARMGVSLAADAPALKGFGTVAGLSTKALVGTKYGGKILGDMGLRSAARYANANIAQRALMNIPSSMLSGAINLGLYEGTSNVANNISVGEDTSLGNTLGLFGEGFLHGGVTGGVLGMFGAATKGLGSNIGIKAGDKGLTKALHGAEKGLYNLGALGVEGMGFHTADQINKFLSGEATDENAGEFITGTLEGAVMAGMLKLTSTHNAENVMRGISSGKPVAQFKDGLSRFFSTDSSDLRLTDVDRKALSFLGDVDQVMKNVKTADDAAGIYKEVMENPKVPFSTKQKFSAMTVGTMSASKPIWNALYLLEDNTVETVKRTIDEQGNVHEQVIDRFEFNDKDDYKAKLQELNDERENQIMRNGYALHTQMLAAKMPGLREKVLEKFGYAPELGEDNPANQRVIESLSKGGEAEEAFNDAMRELVSQGVKIEDPLLKSFSEEYGMSEDDVLKVINKDFREYTPEEAQMMKDFSNRIWDDLYPANEAHPMQSMERGQMLADQAEVGQVVNTGAVQQLSEKYMAAKQAYDAYLDSLSIKPEDLAGMSYPEQVDYIRENFGDERAKDYILPLWDAELQNQGFFERLRQRTEEAADSVAAEMEFKGTVDGNKEDGVVYTIRDADGNEYTLKGGNVVFTEDGHVDPTKSSKLIIAFDAEGHPVSFGASPELTLAAKETKDERRARMLEEIQSKTTEEYLANGGLGDLVGQKLNVDPRKVQQEENTQPPLRQENGEQPVVEAGAEGTGANETTGAAPAESQQQIPVSKNGHTKEYHKVDYETAIDDILKRDNSKVSWNNDPAKIADSYLKAAQKSLDELDKKNKSLVKRAKEEDFDPDELDDITNGTENTEMGKYFAKKAEIQEKIDYYNGLKEEWNKRRPVVEPIQSNVAPIIEEDPSVREAIVNEKSTLKSKWNALHKLYDGTEADDGEILDETQPLDINELVAMNMPRGIAWSSYVIDGTHKVRGLSEELGFDKKRRIGKDTNTSGFNTFLAKKGTGVGIDEVVHRIWESSENSLPNGEKRFDDQEIRDAVIEMFLNAERPSDITNYVVNNRSRLANEKVEQARRYEEEMQRQYEEEQKAAETQQQTEQDKYLEPRNDKEKEIVADVEKKLAEEIKDAEEEVRKAKSALEKAQVEESDKATDVFSDDEAFREEDQLFDSFEMPTDRSQEGVERRTEAERERLMEAEAKLESLKSEAEHDSRVRGVLDNERRQTTIEETPSEEGKSAGSIQSDMPFAPAESDYVPFQKVEEFKPIGKSFFGNVYDQFKGRVKEAFNFLLKNREGDLLGVFHRSDIGDIDLIWGKHENHEGLEHMIMDHVVNARDFDSVEELMNVLDDVIKNGKVIKRNSKDKAQIMKDGYLVAVRKQHRNQKGEVDFKKNWVITAFDTNRKEHEKKRPESEAKELRKQIFGDEKETSPKGTLTTPPLNPEADGVTLPSSDVSSESKDSKKDDTLQENQQKVAKINTSDPMEAINQAANSFKEGKLSKIEKTIRDGVVKLMKKAGIGVSTDWKEGQKIIDRYNSRVKTQKGNGPIFTSNAGRALESIKQEKATPEQWLKMIEKSGGLKSGEDKWMGLSDWLKSQDKKSLTKQEVMDYIRENSIQIEETNYQESVDIDSNPQMKEFRSEFENLTKKLEDEKEAVEQEANAFNDEMYQKYGEGWANDPDRLSEEDQRRNDEMIERWQKLNDEDIRELAFREMVEKYGDDFEMAFEYNPGNGRIEPQMDMYGDNISDAAKHFLQLEEQPINSTRLSYTTEGLDNKKEIALTVPTVESWNESDEVHFGDAGNGRAVAWVRFGETTVPKKEKVIKVVKDFEEPYKNFKGMLVYYPKGEKFTGKDYVVYGKSKDGKMVYVPIMNQEQVAAFDTLDEARNAMNEWYKSHNVGETQYEKVLVIDEIQSKRHQEGREKGYRKELPPYTEDMLSVVENDGFWEIGEDLGGGNVRNLNYYSTEMMSREEAVSEYIKTHERVKPGIPDAPFDKNWHELAMKRMLRYAAENGYDKVAWTKGEQQAERYGLGNKLDTVETYTINENDKKEKVVLLRGPETSIRLIVDYEGTIIQSNAKEYIHEGTPLDTVVGKELALKIMQTGEDSATFKGEDLRIGGEGMKGFYDQMLPRFMDKYGKKWGVKTGEVELPNVEEAGRKMWSVDVTPEMKESVMEGQPMFFKTKDGQAYGFVKDGKIYIDPRIATAETPVHEYTHLWAEGIRRVDEKKWKDIVKILKNDKAVKHLWEKIEKDYPELKDDDARAEEILSQYSGKRGAERLRAEAAKIQEEQGEESAKTFVQKMKQALTDFWKSVAEKFGKPFTSAEDISDMVMKDLMAGKNPNEWRKKSLMGVHNVSEEKLRKILKQGGLTNPSLAVIDTNHNSHTDYGEISLIPKSDLVDSKRGGNAGTWTADAWTPTYPQVVKRMSKSGEKAYDKDLQKAIPGRENSAVRSQMDIRFNDYLENGRSPEGLALWYLAEKGLNPEIVRDDRGNFDYYRTIDKARKQFKGHEEEFKKWLEEKEAAYGVEEYLWNGTDNQGRNKWIKNTLDNASRLMKKQGRAGAVNWSGTGSMIATVAKRLKTKEQINKSKENLSATREDYDTFHEKWGDELYRLAEACGDGDAWYGEARLQEALGEYNPIAYLKKEYGVELSDEDKQSINNFINEVQNTFPARYFETKFERPVGLDEFEIAVVPSTTSPDIVDALKNAGLDVRTYEKSSDEEANTQNWRNATMDAVRDRDDIMFQRTDEKENVLTESTEDTKREEQEAYTGYDPMEAIEKNAARFKQEQGEDVLYRKGTNENQPVENRAVVEGHVNTLKSEFGEKIQTANSVSEITNEKVKKKIENGEKVMGWYDKKTDSVHLYMPNIPNSYEAEKTVWHETVGHKGMRQLLGEEGYKKYMMKLWMDEKNAELSKFVKERLVENGYNPYEAIDEWLSQKAEGEIKNPYENASMWQKVREALSENLRKAGYRMSPSIMDVKYMTWLSEQNRKGKVSDAKKRKMLEKLMNEKYDTNTFHNQLYRKPGESEFDAYYRIQTGNGNTPVSLLARAQYRDAIYRSSFAWDESHHDYMAAWREFQKAQAQGNPIPDHMNALMLENEMDSKIKTAGDIYVRDYALPAQEAMNECLAKLNVDSPDEAYWQLNDYMYQKVGLQVNRQMYVRDWLRKQKANGNDVSKQEQEWYNLKADLKQKVDSGQITLRDYYQKTDEWIKKNISNKYVANEHDASGLTSFSGAPDGKTYDDGKILDNVMNMENLLGKQSAEKLWEQMKRITDFSLETEYAGGLVNKASIDAARSQYDWYIPLRGYDETTAEDMWSYLNRSGKEGLYAPTLAERKGRRSKAEDPIATAFMMGENAIRRAGRNQVKQAALRFARKFTDPTDKNSLITETDVWVHNVGTQQNPDWVVEYPNIKPDAKPHEVTQAVEQFNQQMAQLEKAGMAQKLKQAKGNIPYRFDNARNISEHIIEAKVNGESHLLVFNDNPRAAQAINGLLKPRATSEWMAKANRLMSQAYTSWAPTFIVRNAIRDAEFASSMLSVKEGWNYCGDFMNNYLKLTVPVAGGKKKPLMFDLFMKHRRGTLDDNNPIERMFKEFIENGGVTGYTQENNIEKWHDDLVKSFKNAGKKNAGKNAVKWFFEGVEKMNESVENAARFATYMTSRMGGNGHTPRTIIRAVADAKEVSVNFNRKGAGWKTATLKDENGKVSLNARTAAFTGQYLRDTALFYNATIQGIANSLGNARLATTKFATRFAIPPFVVGALIPLLNQWIHDTFDDEDDGKTSDNPYADLPEWDRRSNLCIYLGNNNFFKIPLSLEHRAFYGIGDVAAGVIYDEKLKSIDKPPIVDAVKQLSTFSPVDYTDTEIGMEGPVGKIIGVLTPAVVKPWVQAANNTSWTGVPIQKENKFNGDKVPEYQKAYEGKTNQLFVDAANLWHQFWGGNDIERAGKNENLGTAVLGNELVEGIGEISPAKAQYLAEQVPGETGKLVTALASGAYNLGKGVATGQSVKDIFDLPDWNVKMIPGVKAFFSQGNEQSQFYRARTKAYRYLDEMRDVEYAAREYKKQSADNPAKKIEQQEFEKTKRYKQYEMYKKDYKKDLDKYYKEIKAEKDPKKRRDLKEEQNIKMKQFVDAMDRIE